MYFNRCVYTIKQSDLLEGLLSLSGIVTFRENKNWKGAAELKEMADVANEQLIIVFAPAEQTRYLHSWAIITDIKISQDKTYTKYSFRNLTKINAVYPKSNLKLASTGKKLDVNFIKPYALCLTPFDLASQDVLFGVDEPNEFVDTVPRESQGHKGKDMPTGVSQPEKTCNTISSYKRVSSVKDWVIDKAHGKCEKCGNKGPFIKDDGSVYLEGHHLKSLANGGSDTVENTVALCPNCHRELHFSKNRLACSRDMRIRIMRFRGK